MIEKNYILNQFSYYKFIKTVDYNCLDYLATKYIFIEKELFLVKRINNYKSFLNALQKNNIQDVVFLGLVFKSVSQAILVQQDLEKNNIKFMILRG